MIYTSDFADVPLLIYDLEKNELSFMNKSINQKEKNKFLIDFCKKDKKGFLKWLKKFHAGTLSESSISMVAYSMMLDGLECRNGGQDLEGKIGRKIFLEVKG